MSLGSTKEIGRGWVADGRFENLSEACRAGLSRLPEDVLVIDWLVALGEESLAGGIDAFVGDASEGG